MYIKKDCLYIKGMAPSVSITSGFKNTHVRFSFANMKVLECPVALYCPLLLITVVMAIMRDMKMQIESKRESENLTKCFTPTICSCERVYICRCLVLRD